MYSEQDHRWMAHALCLAKRGLFTTDPNPRVGCVIVKDGVNVGEGWHQHAGQDHAEIIAINNAGLKTHGATAYVTLEPCNHFGKTPPCSEALLNAGISEVVIAIQDPNPLVAGKGIDRLKNAGVEVKSGLHEEQAELLNKGFCKRMRIGLPWVMSKMAVSLDGCTSISNGDSKWITSQDARRDVHLLRARSSAIISGAGTVRLDNPLLTVRLEDKSINIVQPLRVVLDSGLNLSSELQVFNQPGRVILFTLDTDLRKQQVFLDKNVQVCVVNADQDGQVSLPAVLQQLADMEINEVMVEAGPTLNGRLLEHELVDEWLVYQAAVVLGNNAHGMFNITTLENMGQAPRLRLVDVRNVGADLRLHYFPVREQN